MDELTLWKDQQIKKLKRELDSLYARMLYDFCTPLFEVMGQPPLLHVREDRNTVYVTADIPDLRAEDLEVAIEGGILTIQGSAVGTSGEGEHRTVHTRSFSTRLRLPAAVDEESVQAGYDNGVLTLVLPKQKRPQAMRIQIMQG